MLIFQIAYLNSTHPLKSSGSDFLESDASFHIPYIGLQWCDLLKLDGGVAAFCASFDRATNQYANHETDTWRI